MKKVLKQGKSKGKQDVKCNKPIIYKTLLED